MILNIGDIRGGMDVYSIAGERVGTVTDVRLSIEDDDTPQVDEQVTIEFPAEALHDTGDDAQADNQHGTDYRHMEHATIGPTHASISYFVVEGEHGAFYIPFTVVITLFPGENVTLECTLEECGQRYRERPT